MIKALRAGRNLAPREAPILFCSMSFVKTFLLLRDKES